MISILVKNMFFFHNSIYNSINFVKSKNSPTRVTYSPCLVSKSHHDQIINSEDIQKQC